MIDGFAVVWNYVTQPIAPRLGALEIIAHVGEFGVYGAIVGLNLRAERRRSRRDSPQRNPRAASKTSSRRRLRSAISMATAACSRTAATTSTTSRGRRRSRRSATCCGTAAADARELGDLQSQLAAARALPEPIIRLMRIAAAGRRHGRAAHAHVRTRTLRSGGGRRLAAGAVSQGRAADGADRQASSRRGAGCMRAGDRLHPDPALGTRRTSSTCSPASGRTRLATRAFDVALMLHADHELNASTFAARVAAATLTDIYSAVVAAIGTLKGPLHGGANAEVMKMLLDLGAGRGARARGRGDPREVRAQGEDSRLRPSRLPDRGSARDAPAADVAGARRSAPATPRGTTCPSGSRRWSRPRRS